MSTLCPICQSGSPESLERLREIARIGLARFLLIARKAGVNVTDEQKRDIYDVVVNWEYTGEPDVLDWFVHTQAERAALWFMDYAHDKGDLQATLDSLPPWDANSGLTHVWDCEAEHREAERLEPLLRGSDTRGPPPKRADV